MYLLELLPSERPPRCLVSISPSGIAFNITGHREFESLEEVEAFKKQWKHHFFNLELLAVIRKPEKQS